MARGFNAADVALLKDAYRQVNRSSGNSVRAAWRFGQTIDSFTDAYTLLDITAMMGLSYATVHKYHKFYGLFQRPELALQLAEELESWDIQLLITTIEGGNVPVRRPLAGRHFRYRCENCGHHEIKREEYDPESLVTV